MQNRSIVPTPKRQRRGPFIDWGSKSATSTVRATLLSYKKRGALHSPASANDNFLSRPKLNFSQKNSGDKKKARAKTKSLS